MNQRIHLQHGSIPWIARWCWQAGSSAGPSPWAAQIPYSMVAGFQEKKVAVAELLKLWGKKVAIGCILPCCISPSVTDQTWGEETWAHSSAEGALPGHVSKTTTVEILIMGSSARSCVMWHGQLCLNSFWKQILWKQNEEAGRCSCLKDSDPCSHRGERQSAERALWKSYFRSLRWTGYQDSFRHDWNPRPCGVYSAQGPF